MALESTFASKIRCIVLALLPALGMYHFLPGISLGFFVLLAFVLFDFAFVKGPWKINWDMITIVVVFIFVNLFSYQNNYKHIDYTSFVNNLMYLLFFMFVATYYTSRQIDSKFFERVLLFLGVVFSVLVLIQAFYFLIKGESVSFLLPIETDLEDNIDSIQFNGRPNSVFQEPAHFAIFMIPLLYNALNNKRVILAVLFTASIFISTSTYGLLSALIVYLIFALRSKNGKLYFSLILISCSIVFYVFYDFFKVILETNVSKTQESIDISENARFMGGVESFQFMNFLQYVLGIGYNQTKSFMEWNYLTGATNYSNSFFFSMYAGGMVGLTALFYFLKKIYTINSDKTYFIILLLTLLTDQIIFNQNFLYLIFVIYFIKPQLNENSTYYK